MSGTLGRRLALPALPGPAWVLRRRPKPAPGADACAGQCDGRAVYRAYSAGSGRRHLAWTLEGLGALETLGQEQRRQLVRGHRLAQQEALHFGAALRPDEIEL